MHLLHQRANRDDALPILLAHGWPDSGWRYRRVLPALVDAGLHVVVPDMPGYGFSAMPPAAPELAGRRRAVGRAHDAARVRPVRRLRR
ncbi:alpha/beta fold hydrolase [Curtobacterium sp. MCPF17_052]|uniref:alpha/beta fold hydrolase n=1 Tax=Curtobacterium sp. MCPF17_052 TaxID=2175655 RepID=UPI0024E026B6|nr:alpha/beta fold hydrolase [Curtobacterium sp. MCPF17_052]WIB13552.1 alpha/beta fold hydrolase [Curtobacterium sp. MCPF17_052]